MTHEIESELKERARRAGLTTRELAEALDEPCGTTSNRLNGFLELSEMQRRALLARIESAEREQENLL